MHMKFYKCEVCGNIAVKVFDSGKNLSCCGQEMTELVANTTDAAVEKHVPEVTVDGAGVHVQVGSVEHPMLPEHYIAFVCLETEQGYQIAELTSDDKPVVDFVTAEGDKPVRVYEYCNLHGLWVAEI
ncbi:desulfoferrodoxin [Eggerthellaceae bacterium zg-893]|uniref:Desulfoferrodoxin n=2 Tax=Xiamenia xianingshaonis TaxID=2682776 RepID=A0A9E6SV48_9ACTN|nr:desulfoferrodoxin [Eggerthellaceae bacterium zg-893]NHM14345.1 desulfoferrodoxin [Xiamenia xianingshaonis]QTU85178.1 desulfoferrodoxin [Xiamenia xianingshaonis]